MTDPIIKPEHRRLVVQMLTRVSKTAPDVPLDADDLSQLEKWAETGEPLKGDDGGVSMLAFVQALADLEATVESRVRRELADDARRYRELEGAILFLARDENPFDVWEEDDGFHAVAPDTRDTSPGYVTPGCRACGLRGVSWLETVSGSEGGAMSRSGFSEGDCDDDASMLAAGRWNAQVRSATRGKRGQKFFRDLVAALDAMPEKKLVAGHLEKEGAVCALGALGRHRGVPLATLDIGGDDPEDDWEDSDWDKLASTFDIAQQLAREVMYNNDEYGRDDEHRWQYVRQWAARRIIPTEEELETTQPGER